MLFVYSFSYNILKILFYLDKCCVIVGGEGESGGSCGRQENDDPLMMGPDSFIDEFPMDMFDNIEALPSPSDW